MRRSSWLTCTVVSLAIAAVAAVPASAPAAPQASASGAGTPATLYVSVRINGFKASGKHAVANGLASATLTNFSGQLSTIHQQVTLSAATGASCQVLHLFLNQLNLNLLGLNAHLDKVILDITGHQKGGVLGQLFCKLSRGLSAKKASAASGSAARALNARLRHHPVYAARFAVRLTPQASAAQAPAPTCQVLDLVLGPLNLTLLGLEVDLNQVHLNVTATPTGGVLGGLFCSLANSSATPGPTR